MEPAEPVDPSVLTPADHAPDKTERKSAAGICPVCGEPVEKEPGQLRRRKYHEDCRPLKSVSSPSSGTRRTRAGKAEAEADEAIAAFKSWCMKGALMLSAADPYDSFCVMVALPDICMNLRGILIRYEGARREFRAMAGGGSIIGLVMVLIMMTLPMLAHHGILPSKWRVSQLMVNMPVTMFKLQQQMKDGEANLAKLMKEQMDKLEEVKRAARQANMAATVETQGQVFHG